MSDTPETDDQPIIYALNELQYQVLCVDLEFARKVERERDEAKHEIEGWRNKWNIAVEMAARAENERDGNKYELDEEMKWHHRTHEELVQTQCKLLDMERERNHYRDAILACLEENAHLADGEDCTLILLKRAILQYG